MKIKQRRKRLLTLCFFLSATTLMSCGVSINLLINSDFDGAIFFFIFGLFFLLYPCAFYYLLNSSLSITDKGISSNKFNKYGFNGYLAWSDINHAKFGNRRGFDYVDIHLNPIYPENNPTVLCAYHIRIFTEYLNIENKNLSFVINKKINGKNTKNKDLDVYSFIDKLEDAF